MRDRETDSWWSIMTSDAIGGELLGRRLVELPHGEKVQFRDWVERHPATLVLSVNGRQHVRTNPYDHYFRSRETFRGLRIEDDRLPPKEPIFAFRIAGEPWAVSHEEVEGGRLLELEDGQRLLLWRPEGASFYASTAAWRLSGEEPAVADVEQLVEGARAGEERFEPLSEGFDTYWYTWAAINPDTRLVSP